MLIEYTFFRILKETLRDEESSQLLSDDYIDCDDDYQQDVPDKTKIRSRLHNSKLKIRQLDRIISALRKQNNRQRKSIKTIENTLKYLKDKLDSSNQALASLTDPEFEFC